MRKVCLLIFIIFVGMNINVCRIQARATDQEVKEAADTLRDTELIAEQDTEEGALPARQEAADALANSGNPKAIKPLLEALKDTEPSIRITAAECLGGFGDKSVIPYLMEALKKEHERESDTQPESLFIQSDLIFSLKKLGISLEQEKEIMPYVENLLEEDDEFVPKISDFKNREVRNELVKKTRELATELCYYAGETLTAKQQVEKCIYDLKNGKPKVKRLAAKALGKIGDTSAIFVLLEATYDTIAGRYAFNALRHIGSTSIPILINILANKNEEEEIRISAIYVLGDLGASAKVAVPVLIETLKDTACYIRIAAIVVLGDIGSSEAIPALVETLRTTYDKDAAVDSLIRIGSSSIPALLELLKNNNNDNETVWRAKSAIARIRMYKR